MSGDCVDITTSIQIVLMKIQENLSCEVIRKTPDGEGSSENGLGQRYLPVVCEPYCSPLLDSPETGFLKFDPPLTSIVTVEPTVIVRFPVGPTFLLSETQKSRKSRWFTDCSYYFVGGFFLFYRISVLQSLSLYSVGHVNSVP